VSEMAAAGALIVRDLPIRNGDGLIDALCERRDALGFTNELLDDLGGFYPGFTEQFLGPSRRRKPSLATLNAFTEILCVSFVMIDAPEKRRLMTVRCEARQVGLVDRAREGGRLRWKGISKEQRSAIARAAANARWAKRAASIEGAARG
jgi:hypothetical protein